MNADTKRAPSGSSSKTGPQIKGYTFRPWKIALLGVAIASIVAGVLLAGGSGGASDANRASSGTTTGTSPDALKSGFRVSTDGDGKIGVTLGDDERKGEWSPALLRGGLSFFVAFCLAFAFRSFMRIAVIFLGVWIASLYFLDHLGWIEIYWSRIEAPFDDFTSKIGDQLSSAKAFLTGSLPSAGAAAAGLFTGFRRG